MEKQLEIIAEQSRAFQEFAVDVHRAHIGDKAWLRSHIDRLASGLHSASRAASTNEPEGHGNDASGSIFG